MNKRTIEQLKNFLAIQSVSTDPARTTEMEKAVEFLTTKLKTLGFDVAIYTIKEAPSFIAATLQAQKQTEKTKTIGIYGHYDVQPEDPVAEWETKPFDLTERNGKMYARGIADDKGHIMQNILALEELIKKNQLNNNIVLLFEGEEETGSKHFASYVQEAKEALMDIDVFFITDMGMHAKNVPQIFYALRGILYFELNVQTVKRDLHSGIYGNTVLNPAQVLAELLAKMKDVNTGEVLIPHFYDNVRVPDESELKLLEKTVREESALKEETGAQRLLSVRGVSPSLVSKILPSLDVNGMVSGYTGQGSKTIIPKEAMAKFSIRIVEHQNPQVIESLVREFVTRQIPEGVSFDVHTSACEAPFYTSLDNPFVKSCAEIMRDIFGNNTLFNRSGGSVPAAEMLQRFFAKPIILTGFTLPDDNIHSPNENFDKEMFEKGIEALKKIYVSSFE